MDSGVSVVRCSQVHMYTSSAVITEPINLHKECKFHQLILFYFHTI